MFYVSTSPSRVFITRRRRKCSYVEVKVYADSTTRRSTSKPRTAVPSHILKSCAPMADLRPANPRASHGRRCMPPCHPPSLPPVPSWSIVCSLHRAGMGRAASCLCV